MAASRDSGLRSPGEVIEDVISETQATITFLNSQITLEQRKIAKLQEDLEAAEERLKEYQAAKTKLS